MKIIKADKEELFNQFEFNMMETTAYLDTKTDEIIYVSEHDVLDENKDVRELLDAEPERFVAFPEQDSRCGYDDMVDFTNSVEDGRLRDLLAVALSGSGVFRRFKDVLFEFPAEKVRWFEFEEKRKRKRFDEWLESEEIKVVK